MEKNKVELATKASDFIKNNSGATQLISEQAIFMP